MRINHNIAAINTNRLLGANNSNTSKSLEKLSSGLSVNRAGDNAAGLAISEKMRGQIRGLNQATNNANDGIKLIQTTEGALNETHSILQRMRELAVQSANDTNTADDRKEIQKEIEQLTKEITRIATDTEFNTQKLLDGSMAATAATDNAAVTAKVAAGSILEAGTYTATITYAAEVEGSAEVTANGVVTLDAAVDPDNPLTIGNPGDYAGDYTGVLKYDGTDWKTDDAAATVVNVAAMNITNAANGDKITVTAAKAEVTAAPEVKSISIVDGEGNNVDASNFDFTFTANIDADTAVQVTVDATKAMTFHIGANSGQNTKLTVQSMKAEDLGVANVDLTTQASADAAISTIDDAINTVSAQRAALGAMQNRLEHTISNLGTSSENLSAAESQIRDVDMAEEMSEFTKNNILVQAATSMLAQANQQPQNVLSLLQ